MPAAVDHEMLKRFEEDVRDLLARRGDTGASLREIAADLGLTYEKVRHRMNAINSTARVFTAKRPKDYWKRGWVYYLK